MICNALRIEPRERPPLPTAPNRDDWCPISEAAQRLDLHRDHLTRKCRDELARTGDAVLARPHDGGKASWWIKRSHHRKLSLQQAPAAVPDLSQFTEAQQRQAWARVQAVQTYRRFRDTSSRPVKAWIGTCLASIRDAHPDLKITLASLRRWQTIYNVPADVVQLIDRRGGDQKSQGDPAAWSYFSKLYLQDSQPSAKECWRRVKAHAERGEFTWCSYASCRRQLDQRIPPEVQIKHRKPRVWRQTLSPTIEQDPEAWAAGTMYESDHSQLDLWCRFGGSLIRPWLTVWKDWRTRRIVGYCLAPSPNSSTILAALRMAMMDDRNFGGPDAVRIDNGRDYDCWFFHGQTKAQRLAKRGVHVEFDEGQFAGIFKMLGIDEVHFSLPYNPNGKSRAERWFGILHSRFDTQYPSYAGRSVADKPEELKRIIERPGMAPSFEEVRSSVGEFIEAWNASADHSIEDLVEGGVKLSPDEALANWCDRRKVFNPEALDHCLQHWHQPVRAHRNGITIHPFGAKFSYGAFDPTLRRYKAKGRDGKKPLLHVSFDPDDLSKVKVYDQDMRFVVELKRNEKSGVKDNREQVARLMKLKRQYANALKVVEGNRELEYLTAAQLIALDNAKRRPTSRLIEPPPLKLVKTMLERPIKAVQKPSRVPVQTPEMLERMRWGHEEYMRRQQEQAADDIDILADDGVSECVSDLYRDDVDEVDVLNSRTAGGAA